MTRIDGRAPDERRPIFITPDYLSHPLASVLISCGNTRVVCAASVFKPEGRVCGTGAKMFTIAGPVIVYGTLAAVVYGGVLWLLGG